MVGSPAVGGRRAGQRSSSAVCRRAARASSVGFTGGSSRRRGGGRSRARSPAASRGRRARPARWRGARTPATCTVTRGNVRRTGQAPGVGLAEPPPGGAGVERQPVEHRRERLAVAVGGGDGPGDLAAERAGVDVERAEGVGERVAAVQPQLDVGERRRARPAALGPRRPATACIGEQPAWMHSTSSSTASGIAASTARAARRLEPHPSSPTCEPRHRADGADGERPDRRDGDAGEERRSEHARSGADGHGGAGGPSFARHAGGAAAHRSAADRAEQQDDRQGSSRRT